MTIFWKIVWPVILLALLAPLTATVVEDPPYTVSAVHVPLVFTLALFAVFHTLFSSLRYSYASLAAAISFAVYTFASALAPDLWLRLPEISLLGIGVAQCSLVFLQLTGFATLRARLLTVIGLGVLALSVVYVFVYMPQLAAIAVIKPAAAITGAVLAMASAVFHWKRRQRLTATGLVSWLLQVLLITGLVLLTIYKWHSDITVRQQVEVCFLYSLLFVVGVFVAEQLQTEQQLRSGPHMNLEASFRDPLTNLANRRALEIYGPRIITQSHDAGRAVSLIVADLDHFKLINDTHGHLAGDAVLVETAAKLSAAVRKSDMVARYGGEEFVILLPGSPLAPALRLAERIRAELENDVVDHEGIRLTRTASFGVATSFPEDSSTLAELIERADKNLYRAKYSGRNCVRADALPANDF